MKSAELLNVTIVTGNPRSYTVYNKYRYRSDSSINTLEDSLKDFKTVTYG